MKTIGLLGGMSSESTIDYYRRINAGVNRELGGHHAARMLIYSADLHEVFDWLMGEDHDSLAAYLGDAAVDLERSGADFVIIACNTAHVVAPQIAARLGVPMVHIADVLGEALTQAGIHRVGLFASVVVTEDPFYRQHLREHFGIEVLTADPAGRAEVDRVIREELCFHDIREESRGSLTGLAEELGSRGADAVVLACTELCLLFPDADIAGLPIFDTTTLHAERTIELALGRRPLTSSREAAA
ncbi:MAG: amino acid racemase [Thermoanaerobaculia bacterium]|nr:amino acid racemase [Thermoanaerobaculia bacterium]